MDTTPADLITPAHLVGRADPVARAGLPELVGRVDLADQAELGRPAEADPAGAALAAAAAADSSLLEALPGLAGSAAAKPAGNILQTVATEDEQAIVIQKNMSKNELDSAATIASNDLSKAGTALGSGHIGQAAVDVTAVALIGTGIFPYVAIQGAALLLELPVADIAIIGEQL